jgi:FkbM family methyltransferase
MENNLKFNLHGVNYNINPDDNKNISIFQWFTSSFTNGNWEANTFEVFNYVKNVDKKAIDIGAWIGPTSIWLSKNFKEVLAIDADLVAVEALKANLKTSECFNTQVLDKPIHSVNTKVTFGTNQYDSFYQSEGLGASTSQIKDGGFIDSDYTLETITLDQLNQSFPFSEVSFVKVDIEGGEELILEDLIKNAKKYNWELWISFHYDWWKDKNINRFDGLFDDAIDIRSDNLTNKIHSWDAIDMIKLNPRVSLYIKYENQLRNYSM